jgi:hypothetical protein
VAERGPAPINELVNELEPTYRNFHYSERGALRSCGGSPDPKNS